MNELIELWNSSQVLTTVFNPILIEFKDWIMNMSLNNLIALVIIIFLYFSISLTVTLDGVENNRPKSIISLITLILMFGYPNQLWIAALPFILIIFSTLFWQKPLFWYLNLFLPLNKRMRV